MERELHTDVYLYTSMQARIVLSITQQTPRPERVIIQFTGWFRIIFCARFCRSSAY